ncbi:hypothetical protein K5I29_02435 [Flavobacterium agricola]|uniref:DUF4231 domain-containing protein n=1 Tax=Flavobacterium agricola TaxID=2870839 RepID=A0ABY6M0M5_9FLAO|nr:hypothetical protein [Flavobacterium agricola]UYW01802.1 hypothetical protein K5I29_02435 [Flavobacterium agricola]
MKNYNVINESLEIKDDLKNHYFGMKLLMILWIIIGVIALIQFLNDRNDLWNYIQIFIGFLALIGLYDYQFRKTSKSRILISEIESITERRFLGITRYFVLLKNRKKRNLPDVKNDIDLERIKNLINQ